MIGTISHCAWLHERMVEVAAAFHAGDQPKVEKLLAVVRDEGGPGLESIARRALQAAASSMAGGLGVADLEPDRPPYRSCDFCGEPRVGLYYPFEPFTLTATHSSGQANVFHSGDRMYACTRCRSYVDTNDWAALKAWVGPAAAGQVVLLWNGFRMNRAGPAVAFDPDTDPEAARRPAQREGP